MPTPRIANDQHGLFSRAQALDDSWTRSRLDRARTRGRVVAVAPGVYASADRLTAVDRRERHLLEARALVLAHGDAWHLARRSAAVLHGLPLLGAAPADVQLTRHRPPNRAQSTSRHRRVHPLLPHETEQVDGLPVTTLARTVFDIARQESFRSGVVVADAALRSGLTSEELLSVLADHPRWPGSRRARLVMGFADGRAESPLESLGRVACLEEDLPVFEPQVEVWYDGELIGRVDGLWREQLVVFEGDGGLKFEGVGVLPALLARQERLREAGLTVVRASWADLTRRRAQWAVGVRRELAENPGRARSGVQVASTRAVRTPLDTSDHYRWTPLPFATPRLGAPGGGLLRGVA
ncbi:MAG TPA: hypothetical protein VMZ11_07915 [Mycobacteriales bacterium]|nr:hypothetical protein [Mycobacteriales bacterium]